MPSSNNIARYLRAHHWRGLAIAAVVLVADIALSVHTDVSAPAASNSGYIMVPLALQVPLIIVCLVASSIDGKMANLEEAGSRALRRCQVWYLVGASCASALLVGGTAAVIAPLGTAVVLVRAVAIWTGMALLSGRVLRWSLAWVLPLASFFPLNYFGADNAGHFYWWYWARQPAGQVPCALIAVGSLAVGACAVALTPWRLASHRAAAVRMLNRLTGRRHISFPDSSQGIHARANNEMGGGT
jgi:hypothetical protein